MTQYASTSIPKPKNWQDFERHIVTLFRCILDDPNTSTHGRGGQGQQGVDVYGRRNGRPNYWVGIQCKLKDDSEEVTKTELEKEVVKAKDFQPALSEFIIVTTASDDAKIQKIARRITQRHENDGLFSVEVWGWQTLESKITKYPEAMEAFHPDLTQFSRHASSIGQENLSLTKESREDQKHIIALLEQIKANGFIDHAGVGETTADTTSAAEEAIDQIVHKEIDGYRDLLRSGKARTAKELLESLKGRIWNTASNRVRFRIITNIGAALLELGEEHRAADAFLEAVNYDPDDRVGLANGALAHLIKGDPQGAVAAAESALQRDPDNAAAAGYLISGHLGDSSVSDPFSPVPEALCETPEVLASAINFLCQRRDSGWRVLARESADKHPDEKVLQRRAAEAVLDEVVSSERFEIGGILPTNITSDDLHMAASILQKLWDESLASEAIPHDNALPNNLARALWALNQSGPAATVIDQALELMPDDQELRELRAALYFEAGERQAALALTGDGAERPGLALMQARAILEENPQRAREILQGKAFSDAPERQRLAAELLVVETFIQEGQREQALAHAERLDAEYKWSVEPRIELVRVQRLLGKDDADQTLTVAADKLDSNSQFGERFQVANALEDVGRYDDVVAILDGHVDLTRDSPALRLLVFSYINADRRTTAYELLNKLPPQITSQPAYLRALVAVNANRKDFPAALAALDRYLEQKPDDLEMRLRWIGFCFRLNHQDRIIFFLQGDVEKLIGPPELRAELAYWLDRFDFAKRALRLAYSIFLYHSTLPQVHLRYIGLLLGPGCSNSIPLDTEFVGDDVAFEIDDGCGGRSWFVIEPDAELRKDETYIAPAQEIARRANGLRVGEAIQWEGRRPAWTMLALKHKYLHALHRSMENFERHFPTEHGLRRVTIDPDAEEPFEDVFTEVKERHDSIQNVFEVFDKGLIPIHVAASALGSDIIETRYGLQKAGRTYRVCGGTHPERMQAVEAVRSNQGRGCIVDALTLNIIRRLGLEDVVSAICGPIGVTGATRDLFWNRLRELKESGGPTLTLFWQDGYYYRREPTQEEWNEALQIREADLNWIDQHLTIVPAEGAADPPEELRHLNQVIGHNFIDDMLAAQGSSRLLLCQDQAYRVIAAQSLSVRATWLQPLLMFARDEDVLCRGRYGKVIISLIDFGDQVVSIDGGVLLSAASNNPQSFDRAVRLLGGPQAEMLSHIGVAVDFLGTVWSQQPNELATAKQTGMVLENLLKGRSEWRDIIGVLRRLYWNRVGVERRLDHYILSWLQGHFLVAFETTELPLADFKQR